MRFLLLLFSLVLFLPENPIAQSTTDDPCSCNPGPNQITNPDFSMGNTGFSSDMTYEQSCAQSTYYVAAEPRDKCPIDSWLDDLWDNTQGDASGSYLMIDGPPTATDFLYNRVWSQTVLVQEGVDYQFEFSVVSKITQTTGVELKLAVYLNDTNLAGNLAIPLSENWKDYCLKYQANYSGPAVIQIRQVENFMPWGYDYGLDDIYFGNCIPDPPVCDVDTKWDWEQDFSTCTINFENISVSGTGTTIVGYFWDFGDGTTSTEAEPSHFYNTTGTFEVCLTTYGVTAAGECCTETECAKVENHCEAKPCKGGIKEFTFTGVDFNNCEFQFGVNASPTAPVIGYFWDFGDGTTATGPNPTHAFPSSGTYNICVTMIMQDGKDCCTETFCRETPINCIHTGKSQVQLDHTHEPNITKPQQLNMLIAPNPTEDWTQVQFESQKKEDYQLMLINLHGKVLMQHKGQTQIGSTRYELNTHALPAGTYILNLQMGGKFHSEKLIVY